MNCTIPAAISLALLLSACDGGNAPSNNAVAPTTTEATSVPIGRPGSATGVQFTVTKIDNRAQLGMAGAGMKAEPTETYVVVRYTLKNTGAVPLSLSDRPSISLVDAKGQSYATDMSAAAMASDGLDELNGMANDINPNTSAKGVAVWKVEKAAFDNGTWKLVLPTNPQLTFSLK
jgi:hypothetical protein